MQISRESLLQSLETVTPGLSSRDVLEQSSCFAFRDGRVHTFNDEVYCTTEVDLSVEGAVSASSLLELLRKLPDESLEVAARDGKLMIKAGKNRRSNLSFAQEIYLPLDNIERPTKWKKIPAEYSEYVRMVEKCASTDEARFMLTCVHIHPEWIEACDNYHLCRYWIKTGVTSPIYVKRDSIKHIAAVGMTHFAATDSWVHYKNSTGLQLSCRRVVGQDYPDLTHVVESEGAPLELPKGVAEAVGRAEIFSAENPDDNVVRVKLSPGSVIVEGHGISGDYKERSKVAYKGKPMSFIVPPALLADLVQNHDRCAVNESYLMVSGAHFKYVTCLGQE